MSEFLSYHHQTLTSVVTSLNPVLVSKRTCPYMYVVVERQVKPPTLTFNPYIERLNGAV